jgi:NitT/TauT family transport system permease protein
MISSGLLFQHISATLSEMLLGYSLGVVLAFILGYTVAKLAAVQQLILPYLIGLQAIPIVAIAPLLITYLGPGLVTNGIICALIVFFPMLITTNVAFRAIPPEYRDFMRTVSASPWQTFLKLELPAALPLIFGGLKVSTSLAVIGAVVGEGVSAEYGLGYLVYYSRYVFNQSSVFVGLITLMVVAYGYYEAVALLERFVLRWRTVRDEAGS